MTTIISQDRKNIINSEAIERITAEPMKTGDGVGVWVHTLNGADIIVGTFSNAKNADKVMTYIAFALTASDKATVIPSNATVENDKEIAGKFIGEAITDILKKKKPTAEIKIEEVSIDPKIKEFLEKLKGGEA